MRPRKYKDIYSQQLASYQDVADLHDENLLFWCYKNHGNEVGETGCLPASGTVWASDLGGCGAVEYM
jgi:hypothetical protein